MSRRKQPNPNRVKLMETSLEEQQEGGGDNSEVTKEAELKEIANDLKAVSNGATELVNGGEEQNLQDGGEEQNLQDGGEGENLQDGGEEENLQDGGEEESSVGEEEGGGGDLSSINSMMSTVMSAAGTIHSPAHTPSSGPSPSPSPNKPVVTPTRTPMTSRNARRTQDTRDDAYICPLCDKNCLTQHQLTMHIRQHNADTGATDHSCSICGKSLSSASSLDRHMLVHSGERPYKCSVCGQTFTTNGNMHRHMKIHEKDPGATGALPLSPPSPPKRRRPSKRRLQEEQEPEEEPASKKLQEDSPPEVVQGSRAAEEEEELPCPICFQTCCSRYQLEVHMETHPDTVLRCDVCCVTFKTHRGLLRHNATVHKLLPLDPSGRPFIQNNPSIPNGFNELAFIDFSCKKFPHIAQVWCESNLRRCASKLHRFVCEACDKAFPLHSALELHRSTAHPDTLGGAVEKSPQKQGDAVGGDDEAPPPEQADFLQALGLQHVSKVSCGPSDEEVHQAQLESIRVIHVETPSTALPPGSGGLGALGRPLLEACSLQGLSQREALGLLSLQPFLLPPEGGAAAPGLQPGEAGGEGELGDAPRLRVAALPPLAKAPAGMTHGQVQKAMPPLKPKPPLTPRSSLTSPSPMQSSQHASLGCISPSLPPPAPFKPPPSSSSSCSSCSSSLDDGHAPCDSQEEGGGGGRAVGSFPCRFCEQLLPSAGALQAHVRLHLGALAHQCSACDYVAPDKATLVRHVRTHSGERPYVCRVCHYPFTVKANCERHLRKKHAKTSRKDIERNIKYVAAPAVAPATAVAPTPPEAPEAACRYCGQDLRSYRALQLHLRTHDGCQRKPFQCRLCGATFLAKRNCIHHLLKQHSHLPERLLEEHIATATAPATLVKQESGPAPSTDPDQPLDFSARGRDRGASPVKLESPALGEDEPIDLSVRRPRGEVTAEPAPLHPHPQPGCYQLPPGLPPAPPRGPRLKPLLPKPTPRELPPLASIAQIISSVSGAPPLLKREAPDPPAGSVVLQEETDSSPRKRPRKKLVTVVTKERADAGGIDLESSGEFASVERMLANTDANKFSTFLTGSHDLSRPEGAREEEKEESKPQVKGKKNAYSNSVQKMTCPFCPRVFPWASSLQRHMLTHTGQKPFPCPQCDAFFSTKSNCERHLLRKHGVANRTLRRNGALGRREGEEGEHESAESQSETEQATQEAVDLTAIPSSEPAPPPDTRSPELHSPAPKAGQGVQQPGQDASEEAGQQGEPEDQSAQQPLHTATGDTKPDNEDDDCHSNKSLDLNFASKLIDFKFCSSSSSSSTTPQEEQQENNAPCRHKHVCGVCSKGFRYANTLSRHQRAHLSQENTPTAEPPPAPTQEEQEGGGVTEEIDRANEERGGANEESDGANEERGGAQEERGGAQEESDGGESGGEGEGSEEEGGATEPKRGGGGEQEDEESQGGALRLDKRKKICNVCEKRFWSLQDLTRHMRSHTGERPYQCQTCERTFTLKHSLVRHQRIHLKPRDGPAPPGPHDDVSEEGDSASCTPPSTCPPSENESEGGAGPEEEDEEEEALPAPVSMETPRSPPSLPGAESPLVAVE